MYLFLADCLWVGWISKFRVVFHPRQFGERLAMAKNALVAVVVLKPDDSPS